MACTMAGKRGSIKIDESAFSKNSHFIKELLEEERYEVIGLMKKASEGQLDKKRVIVNNQLHSSKSIHARCVCFLVGSGVVVVDKTGICDTGL